MARPPKKTCYRVTFQINGVQKEHRFTNEDAANTFRSMTNRLIEAKEGGIVDVEASRWARGLIEGEVNNYPLYDKLARWGLVPPRGATKTVKDLIEYFQNRPVSQGTKYTYKEFSDDLIEFVGLDFPLKKFTVEMAAKYVQWRETTPCRRNGKKASEDPEVVARRRKPLKPRQVKYPMPNTIKKRIEIARQFFAEAVRLEWLDKNPFIYQHGGKRVNPERLVYIPAESVDYVIDQCPNIEHKALIALRRYAGIRGNSEYKYLNWGLKCYCPTHTDPETGEVINGYLIIRCTKTERYGEGHEKRKVLLAPKLEEVLRLLFDHAKEGQMLMFPHLSKNPGKAVADAFENCGIVTGTPYNLRKSYCCDLIEAGIEPLAYEELAGHSFKTGMRFYQIMHPERRRVADEKFMQIWQKSATGKITGLSQDAPDQGSADVLEMRANPGENAAKTITGNLTVMTPENPKNDPTGNLTVRTGFVTFKPVQSLENKGFDDTETDKKEQERTQSDALSVGATRFERATSTSRT